MSSMPPRPPFACLLQDFPEITDVAMASKTTRHGVECFINTTGPPVRTAPRRLSADKLKVARMYFNMMCSAGICRRSDSPWSSGLHLVPKKDGTSRSCGDYRHLNERTAVDAYPSHISTTSRPACRQHNLLEDRLDKGISSDSCM